MPDEEQLLRFGRMLEAMWTAIRAAGATGDFRPNPGPSCAWCSHRALCPAWDGVPPPYPGWPTGPTATGSTERNSRTPKSPTRQRCRQPRQRRPRSASAAASPPARPRRVTPAAGQALSSPLVFMARHDRMSVVRIAFAPSAASWSITRFAAFRFTIDRTATQSSSASGEIVGACSPGVISDGRVLDRLGAVVLHHQVLPGEHHAPQPLGEHPLHPADLGGLLAVRARLALDQRRLALGDRLADHHEPVLAQRAARRHDVGDGVGQAEVHRDLHRAVQLDDLGADAGRGPGARAPGAGRRWRSACPRGPRRS